MNLQKTNASRNTTKRTIFSVFAAAACSTQPLQATDRLFTYTYEPETMPKGASEFEQWVTLRSQRTKDVGQENYNRWQLREEFEYGVTDNYTIDFYLNMDAESFRDPATELDSSSFKFDGVSLANRVLLLNPADHAVGLSIYLEPTFAGDSAEFEQKILIGQRHGDWKWALNFIHATEWEDNFHETEGEFEVSFGISRFLGKNWAIGLEARNVYVLPEYKELETSTIFVGPAIHYRRENWWATLTVAPQVWGKDYDGNTDRTSGLDLAHNERVTARLIFGIHF